MEYRSVSTDIVPNQFPKFLEKTEYSSVSTEIVPNEIPRISGENRIKNNI